MQINVVKDQKKLDKARELANEVFEHKQQIRDKEKQIYELGNEALFVAEGEIFVVEDTANVTPYYMRGRYFKSVAYADSDNCVKFVSSTGYVDSYGRDKKPWDRIEIKGVVEVNGKFGIPRARGSRTGVETVSVNVEYLKPVDEATKTKLLAQPEKLTPAQKRERAEQLMRDELKAKGYDDNAIRDMIAASRKK